MAVQMKPKLFNELLKSVRETGAVMRGWRKAHRETRQDLSTSPLRADKPWMALSGKTRGPHALSTREGFGKM